MSGPTADDFREELQSIFCENEGKPYIDVNSKELHQRVGSYSGRGNHRMPVCCNVMYDEMSARDKVLQSPPKGKGTSLTIRYRFPRFYVYLNVPNNKALIHYACCLYCNHGSGRTVVKDPNNGEWIGPFDEATARMKAVRSGKKLIGWCKPCAGRRGISPEDVYPDISPRVRE